jgi:uncharacterized membrane-anchored protein
MQDIGPIPTSILSALEPVTALVIGAVTILALHPKS